MNREIKFRGISVESNNFIYGVPIISGIHAFIVTPNNRACDLGSRVEPETVSQYTGLKDKNGVEIYEGDIYIEDHEWYYSVVKWGSVDIAYEGVFHGYELNECYIEVIGNIYENPELLKEDN